MSSLEEHFGTFVPGVGAFGKVSVIPLTAIFTPISTPEGVFMIGVLA